jgi:hypothetical protein
MYAAPSTGKTS